jgi:hypothetical protein
MRIFISYSGRHGYDGEVARSIADALRLCNIDTFLDEYDIDVGDDFIDVINHAIDHTCTHLLILASFVADQVPWVKQELERMRVATRRDEVPKIVQGMDTLYAPLHHEVATLFKFLGIPEPPNLETWQAGETDATFLPALCDRQDEQTAFEQAFDDSERRTAGSPKCCILLGDWGARDDLFIERLRKGFLAANASYLATADPGLVPGVKRLSINWPVKWPPRHRLQPVIEALFRALLRPWPSKDRSNAAGLAEVVAAVRENMLIVHHPLPPERWTGDTSKLILDYLGFWREVVAELAPPRKHVIIVFSVTWPPVVEGETLQRVMADVAGLEEKTDRSRVLPLLKAIRLPSVNQKHVIDWANAFADKELALRTKDYCRKLFETAAQRQLDDVVDQYFRALNDARQENIA